MSSANWLDIFSEADKSGAAFAPLPDGTYDLKIIQADITTTSTDKPMYKIRAEVQTGAHAKRLVFDNIVVPIDGRGASFFKEKIVALGITPEYLTNSGLGYGDLGPILVGREFRGTLGTREFGGKQSNEIKKYLPVLQAGGFPAVSAPPVAAPAPAPQPVPQVAPAGYVPTQLPAATQLPQAPVASPWDQAQSGAAPVLPPAPLPAPPGQGFVAPPLPPF